MSSDFELVYRYLPDGPSLVLSFDGTKTDPFDVLAYSLDRIFPREISDPLAPVEKPISEPVYHPSDWRTAIENGTRKKKSGSKKNNRFEPKDEGLFR